VHSVVVTAANVADITQVAKLLLTPGSKSVKNTLGAG